MQKEYQDYINRAENVEKEVLKLRLETPPWHYLKTHKHLKMYWKPSPHFHGHVYKIVTELDFPHDIVYEVMSPPANAEEKLSWDKSLKDYERLATFSEELSIGLLVTPPAALGMIAKREFVDLQYFKTYSHDQLNEDYGEECWIFGASVDFPSRPPSKEYVRGTNYPCGFVVAQNKRQPQKCFVELYVNSDIGGSIPKSLVEAYLPYQQVTYFDCLKAEVKRRLKNRQK